MRAYVDSKILIWHLRGDKKALKFLSELEKKKEFELWTGAMQRAEVVFFMRETEKILTLLFLSQFKVSEVDQRCVDLAADLYRTWNPSHGIDVNDALLAAAAQLSGGKIFTLNLKHFPMPKISVAKAW